MKMRFLQSLFLLFGTFLSNIVFAQLKFGGPSAVTYSPDSKKYYVVNQVTKDVNEMNKWGQGRQFITGLNSPTNILYANLPIGAGFLILDSNQVHLFDTTGFQVGSENVSGAKRLQDFVFDTQKETLYTTDIERNVIYKTTFGPPPFYIPSTKIFADSLRSPAGIYLDKVNNRLLYTEFADSSFIKTVDLSSGSVGTLIQTGLDSVVAIDKDLQGNYYLSSQGDKGVYSWNKYLAGAPKKAFYEPKPSDFMINTLTDEWAYLCYSCGKVYIIDLHIEGPYYEDNSCPGDSATVYLNPGLKTIGTYDKGNKFIAELSDINMSFNTGKNTVVGEVTDTLRPKLGIRSYIPQNLKPGTYKLRIRTTKPKGTSRFELFQIKELPLTQAYTADTASVCSGKTLSLGVGKDSTIAYTWSPSNLVNRDTAANPSYTGNSDHWVYLSTNSRVTGCVDSDSVFVRIITKPTLSKIADTVEGCSGDTLSLGVENKDFDFHWSPGHLVSDSTISNPKYTAATATKFTCTYEAKGGCSNSFEQTAIIHPNPVVRIMNREMYFCPNESKRSTARLLVNSAILDTNIHQLTWINEGGTIDKRPLELDLNNLGLNIFRVKNKKSQCLSEDSIRVYSYDSLKVDLSKVGLDSLMVSVVGNPSVAKYFWYKNNVLISGADNPLYIARDSGTYHVKIRTGDSCFFESERIKYVKASNGIGKLKNETKDFYIVENSYGTQLMSRSGYKGQVSLWVTSLNGKKMTYVEGIQLPYFIKRNTSPGLNIAYIFVENQRVQKIKFVRLD